MLDFGEDRLGRKKLRNKILLLPNFEYQKYFVSHFFPICSISTKLWHKVQLGMTKKRGVNELSIFDRKKIIEFEMCILTDF